jgi:hypothetical protein
VEPTHRDLTPDQVKTARRHFHRTLVISAISYLVVAGMAFWLGSPLLGSVTIAGGAVGLPLAKRRTERNSTNALAR